MYVKSLVQLGDVLKRRTEFKTEWRITSCALFRVTVHVVTKLEEETIVLSSDEDTDVLRIRDSGSDDEVIILFNSDRSWAR